MLGAQFGGVPREPLGQCLRARVAGELGYDGDATARAHNARRRPGCEVNSEIA